MHPTQDQLNTYKQILTNIKGETDNNTITVGNFKTPLTSTDRLSRQKINKETLISHDMLHQMHSIDTYRTFHPKAAEYIFFSSAHGRFSRTDHMLGHITSLCKFKKIEIISSIFSDHNTVRLDINHIKKKL